MRRAIRRSGSQAARYKRSPHIVAYWSEGRLIFHNYATGARLAGTALVVGLLDYFSHWRSYPRLVRASNLSARDLDRALATLAAGGFLLHGRTGPDPAEAAMDAWRSWNPSAGFFHQVTRNQDFERGEARADSFLRQRLAEEKPPPPLKRYPGRLRVQLPAADSRSAFAEVLLNRRTWRRFGHGPVTVDQVATLLGLTFGVQKWVGQGRLGRAMLRTSPSGGARHPLEAYLVARDVRGLAQGVYHYAPAGHHLSRLAGGNARQRIHRYLPAQPFYAAASALVIITAMFARTEWQYPFPRAYRVVQLEAGHFCQTFCLVATSLGLAPFCSAALAESAIERDLSIDGVTESAIYACGVGARPARADSTSWRPRPPWGL